MQLNVMKVIHFVLPCHNNRQISVEAYCIGTKRTTPKNTTYFSPLYGHRLYAARSRTYEEQLLLYSADSEVDAIYIWQAIPESSDDYHYQ